jgi:GTPase SAR1 family protein
LSCTCLTEFRFLFSSPGDIFILVYSIDNRESFEEVKHLHEQILQTKGQSTTGGGRLKRKNLVPIVIVGNKCDKEHSRAVETSEMKELSDSYPSCACIEASAKKNINIEEIFLKLFVLAKLPTEMSPSLHRKVQPSSVDTSSTRGSKRGMTLRRRLSDACGAVTPNARRPSIRTDLLSFQARQNMSETDLESRRDGKCSLQ